NRAKIVTHSDLVADPIGVARGLFDFVSLSWNLQTERYINESTTSDGGQGYYSLKRSPSEAIDNWRKTLATEDQERILAIVRRVPIGRMFAVSGGAEPVCGDHVAPLIK